MADDHLLEIKANISDLKMMAGTLRELSASCSGDDVPDCPLIEALQAN